MGALYTFYRWAFGFVFLGACLSAWACQPRLPHDVPGARQAPCCHLRNFGLCPEWVVGLSGWQVLPEIIYPVRLVLIHLGTARLWSSLLAPPLASPSSLETVAYVGSF